MATPVECVGPIAATVRDGLTRLVLTIHKVTEVIDGFVFIARSHRVVITEGINAVGTHRINSLQMGGFIRREVRALLRAANTTTATVPLVLQEVGMPSRTATWWSGAQRLAASFVTLA